MKLEPSTCQHCGSELVRNMRSIYCSNPLCNYDLTVKSPRWEQGIVLEAGILSLLLGFAFLAVNTILGTLVVLMSIVFFIHSFGVKKEILRLLPKRKTADSQSIQN